MTKAKPTELMHKFWQHQLGRGEKPHAIWCMVSEDTAQPKGYIQGWSVSRQWIERKIARTEGEWSLQKVAP